MSKLSLNLNMHAQQAQVFNDPSRFKVVAAGRRWGKSVLACQTMVTKAVQNKCPLTGKDLLEFPIYYVAPTYDQARRIMWNMLKNMAAPITRKVSESIHVVELINGRRIELKGSDKPDSLLGVGLHHLVLDEYASMKPEVWEKVLRPTLSDVRGSALFIGSPAGKNHFYDIYLKALREDMPAWNAWVFKSIDNPYLPQDEVVEAKTTMSTELYKQEYEASFSGIGSGEMKAAWLEDAILPEVPSYTKGGIWYVCVDPAGFISSSAQMSRKHDISRRDDTAIAVVNVSNEGWVVKEIQAGKWSVRETAARILLAARSVQTRNIGIERGTMMHALEGYLEEIMHRIGFYANIEPVTHGGKNKQNRILFALAGRFEHSRIKLVEGDWIEKFKEQYFDFPNPQAHDDMLDALSYVEQMAPRFVPPESFEFFIDTIEEPPIDDVIGF